MMVEVTHLYCYLTECALGPVSTECVIYLINVSLTYFLHRQVNCIFNPNTRSDTCLNLSRHDVFGNNTARRTVAFSKKKKTR